MPSLETYAQQDNGLMCAPGEMTPAVMQAFEHFYSGGDTVASFPNELVADITHMAEAGSVTARNMLHLLGVVQHYPEGAFVYSPAVILPTPPYDKREIYETIVDHDES